MPRSAADERGNNKFLKWRAKKKDFMLAYAKGQEDRAWDILRDLMLLANRNLDQIERDKQMIDLKDEYRQ